MAFLTFIPQIPYLTLLSRRLLLPSEQRPPGSPEHPFLLSFPEFEPCRRERCIVKNTRRRVIDATTGAVSKAS